MANALNLLRQLHAFEEETPAPATCVLAPGIQIEREIGGGAYFEKQEDLG